MMPRVLNRKDFYHRYLKNEFGNRLQVWNTKEELFASGHSKPIGIRYLKPDSPYMTYGVEMAKVEETVEALKKRGALESLMTFNESAPDDSILINAEIMRSPRYLELFYSTAPNLQMRPALRQFPQHANGLSALLILKQRLDPPSLENLNHLLDSYKDHVIEFSTYSTKLGWANHNTLFWEVRSW